MFVCYSRCDGMINDGAVTHNQAQKYPYAMDREIVEEKAIK